MDALILLIPVLLLLWLILRGRKQQRAASDFQSSLAPGQRVMTSSGLHAKVVEVGDATVVLEPAEGVRMTWARAAVARVVPEPAPIEGTTASAPVDGSTTPGATGGAPVELTKAPERTER